MPSTIVTRRGDTPHHLSDDRISNNEISGLIGMHHSAVSRLRNGEREPSFATMATIGGAFELPDSWLLVWLKLLLERGAEGSGEFLTSIWG